MNIMDSTTIERAESRNLSMYEPGMLKPASMALKRALGLPLKFCPVGLDESDLNIIETLLTEIDLEQMTVQILNWSSPRINRAIQRWQKSQDDLPSGTQERLLSRRFEKNFRGNHGGRGIIGPSSSSISWQPVCRVDEDKLTRFANGQFRRSPRWGHNVAACRQVNSLVC